MFDDPRRAAATRCGGAGTICCSKLQERGFGWPFEAAGQWVGLLGGGEGTDRQKRGAILRGPTVMPPRAIERFINRTLLALKSGEANPFSIAYGSPPTDPGGFSILF